LASIQETLDQRNKKNMAIQAVDPHYTHAYPCLLSVYPCLPSVYSCIPMFTQCIPMFTQCIPMFTQCILMYTHVYNHVHPCLSSVYPMNILICTTVYLPIRYFIYVTHAYPFIQPNWLPVYCVYLGYLNISLILCPKSCHISLKGDFEGDLYLPKLRKHGCSQLYSQMCGEHVNFSDKLWYICGSSSYTKSPYHRYNRVYQTIEWCTHWLMIMSY